MQKIKFWYAYYYQNSGNYGGCISHEVGPFTTKRANIDVKIISK